MARSVYFDSSQTAAAYDQGYAAGKDDGFKEGLRKGSEIRKTNGPLWARGYSRATGWRDKYKCRNCGAVTSAATPFCPQCGYTCPEGAPLSIAIELDT